MAKIFEEIRRLHNEALHEDLKIVISLVLSRCSSSNTKSSVKSFTPLHTYQLHVYLADAFYHTGIFKKAEKHYKDALGIRRTLKRTSDGLERSPTFEVTSETDVRFRLYTTVMELGESKSAIHVLEAVQAKDRTVPVNMALANLYREEGMDRSAVTCYKEVLRSCPLSVEAVRNLIALNVKRLDIATLMIKTSPVLNDEDWVQEWIDLQQQLVERNYQAALNRIRDLDRICPRNIDLLNIKADIYYRNGQQPQAKLIWKEVFDADPWMVKNADKMAYIHIGHRDFSGLEKLSSQLSGANPSCPEPWVVSGAYSLVSNRFDQAVSLAQKALTLQPKCYSAYILKGLALLSGNQLEAIDNLKQAIRLEPYRLEAYRALLETYLQSGKIKDAIQLGNMAIRTVGTNPSTLYIYGKALSKDPVYREKAKTYLEKAIQSDPSFLHAVSTLAEVLLQQQKYKKVIQLLEHSLKKHNTSKLHQLYADALAQLGDRQKAMHHYDIAMNLDANNKRAKEGMERAEKKSELNSMDSSYVGDSLEHSSEMEMNEGVDNLSWSDPELGY